jgi:hypothetical protein
VTNFASAHDTDQSLTVDKYFDSKGESLPNLNNDSIWNFHAWTDVWMSRPDLPPGYGGWQVIDATPQEASDGLYRTGPTSLQAVRKGRPVTTATESHENCLINLSVAGEIGFGYDATFVFSQVNADVVHWQLDDKSAIGWKKIATNHNQYVRSICLPIN